MRRRTKIRFGAVVLALAEVIASGCRPEVRDRRFETGFQNLFAREAVTIAVTDSGLGGLSIMAEAAARLAAARSFRRVDLVFWNALFSNDSGYNNLPTRKEKIRIFDSSLRGLARTVKPDLILVGCNTLSVLLNDTPFARETDIPVLGIVETGADMLAEALAAHPGSVGLLLGTPTTISSGEHRRRIVAAGIAEDRLISQPCPNLVGLIETDWKGEDTARKIDALIGEAAARLVDSRSPVYAALFCTHFGYATALWEQAFARRGLALAGILNPNSRWIGRLDPPGAKGRFPQTEIRTRVISMVEIPEGVRAALGEWLERLSPETAAALRNYDRRPGLFEWERPRSRKKF